MKNRYGRVDPLMILGTIGVITALYFIVGVPMDKAYQNAKTSASTRITGTPNNSRLNQWVVWEDATEAPAHYLNQPDGPLPPDEYLTACGKIFSNRNQHISIERLVTMEQEKRIPCPDCISALDRYTASMIARKANQIPENKK